MATPTPNSQLPTPNKPRHVGIIMDGNRRWARREGLPKELGHKKGVDNLEKNLDFLLKKNIPFVSVYALSTENMKREKKELENLFSHIGRFAKKWRKLVEKDIRVRLFGKTWELPEKTFKQLETLEEETKSCQKMQLGIAINYGGKDEIIRSLKKIISKKKSDLSASDFLRNISDNLSEEEISQNLDLPFFPDLDLIIRTGGRSRISNFLLWRSAYAELYFTEKMWPEFGMKDLEKALLFFGGTGRNFGS